MASVPIASSFQEISNKDAYVRNMQIQRGNANPYASTRYVNHKNNTRQQHFNMQRN